MSAAGQALRAISTFKDEYLLDFINVEELNIRDKEDIDERLVENVIVYRGGNLQNVKRYVRRIQAGSSGC